MENKGIGQVILKLRKERKLSQRTLGEKLSYAQRTISDWESGHTEPGIEAIKRLAEIFNVTYDDLLDF